jgi:L,D-peptidoglycan transpeptidase YkuD (ErfK/YbiS/YcfS/YnhG family)
MDVFVSAAGVLRWEAGTVRCALGRSGIREHKQEGDGATPAGVFPLRRVLYRMDRLPAPRTALPVNAIDPGLGWCDEPADPTYNTAVRLPVAARHERLWREDELYDLLAVIGYNDDPVVRGRGSAIFLHVASAGYPPTEGCVALALPDLRQLLERCRPGDCLRVGV